MKRAIALGLCVILLSGCGKREMLPPSRANHSPEQIEHPEVRRIFTEAITALNALRKKYPHLQEAEPALYVKTLSELSIEERKRVEELKDKWKGDFDSLSSEEKNELQGLLSGMAIELELIYQVYVRKEARPLGQKSLDRDGVYFRLILFPNGRLIPMAMPALRLPSIDMFGISDVVVPHRAPPGLEKNLQTIMNQMIAQLKAIPPAGESTKSPKNS